METLSDRDVVGTRQDAAGGRSLAILGLTLATMGPVLLMIAEPGAAPFVLPYALVPGIGAVLAWRFGTWSKVLAAVLGVLLVVALVVSPAGRGLRHPASFFDFMPSVLFLVGGVAAVVGGIVAVRGRDGRPVALPGGHRPWVMLLLGGAALAGTVSGIASVTSSRTVDPVVAATSTAVVVDDAGFADDPVEVTLGQRTSLLLRNEGRVMHTFTSPAVGVDQVLLPGDEVLVDVTPTVAGTVPFWCAPHSSGPDDDRRGMVGSLAVG